MKKFIIAILSASCLYCKYSSLFIDKIGLLMAYKYSVVEVYHNDNEAVLQIGEEVLVTFKIASNGYVTGIDVEDITDVH